MRVGKYHNCPSYPDHPCDGCRYVDVWGEREFCTYITTRCGLHECIKDQGVSPGKRCIVCVHYHKSLKSDTCSECLQTLSLINFKMQKDLPKEIYKMMEDEK